MRGSLYTRRRKDRNGYAAERPDDNVFFNGKTSPKLESAVAAAVSVEEKMRWRADGPSPNPLDKTAAD
ncbi:hypothetical protein [Paraburkholderia caffeinilytica]|uniref:hypothetical protein n=1 Tax=Paraburkholderia caffeinilytica TaxID=1761016 RepID=UPI003DA04EFA